MPAQGPPRLFLIPPMDWQVNQKLWAFRFLFLTEKLSVLPIRLDMLVWGVWSFACTIKIHCACWDLRPRPREAPIPHQRARLLPGSGRVAGRDQGEGSRDCQALLLQDRCRFSVRGSGCWLVAESDGGQLSVTPRPYGCPGSCGVSTPGSPGVSCGSTCPQGSPGRCGKPAYEQPCVSLKPSPLSLQSHLVLLFSFRVFSPPPP